jgi:hypothetical protein
MMQKKHLIELFEKSITMEANRNFRVYSFHNELKLQYEISNNAGTELGSVTLMSEIDLQEQYKLLNDEFHPMQSIGCRLIFRQRLSDATTYECDLSPQEFWDFSKMFKKAKAIYDTNKNKQADADSKIYLEEINDMFGLDFLPIERKILVEKRRDITNGDDKMVE